VKRYQLIKYEAPSTKSKHQTSTSWRKLGANFGAGRKFFLPSFKLRNLWGRTAGDSLYLGTKDG